MKVSQFQYLKQLEVNIYNNMKKLLFISFLLPLFVFGQALQPRDSVYIKTDIFEIDYLIQ